MLGTLLFTVIPRVLLCSDGSAARPAAMQALCNKDVL